MGGTAGGHLVPRDWAASVEKGRENVLKCAIYCLSKIVSLVVICAILGSYVKHKESVILKGYP